MPDSQTSAAPAAGSPSADGRPLPEVVSCATARYSGVALLTIMALIVFLHWAHAVFIPIACSMLLSYALTPVVNWLKRRLGLHKALGAAITLTAVVGLLFVGLVSLQGQALNVIDTVPPAIEKLTSAL